MLVAGVGVGALFAANQVDPILDGTRLDGFVAGDDADAKATSSSSSAPSACARSMPVRWPEPVSSRRWPG